MGSTYTITPLAADFHKIVDGSTNPSALGARLRCPGDLLEHIPLVELHGVGDVGPSRLDGGGVTYAMGVDEKGYLQPLYWGSALAESDPLISGDPVKTGDPIVLKAPGELSGFDPAGSVTPQEFPGQGEGLVSDPGV